MSTDTYVKKKVLAKGKVKYQAQVWFQGVFYGAKTFDTEKLAREFKEASLLAVLRGELQPAAARKAQRRVEEALDLPMSHWASLYSLYRGGEPWQVSPCRIPARWPSFGG
ncbi:hypothetical protein CDN99_04085 [Roseateles aquatilis]|uniref:Uncharacterized protein n=1 Tax=Roseateles aquatilis TaxID=431061 RepID=A0A246JLW4_9BURK|nr:hypothetical protein [Roseateles aquatilis]OWQ93644.1 hypothetical protein CDN99_04085 [Roseateles aquatilis]